MEYTFHARNDIFICQENLEVIKNYYIMRMFPKYSVYLTLIL
jgi:hypothetical protein